MTRLNVALATVSLFVLPATAFAAEGAPREKISTHVTVTDLDLSKPEDIARLRNRQKQAIEAACNPGDTLNANGKRDWTCVREMTASAERTDMRVASN